MVVTEFFAVADLPKTLAERLKSFREAKGLTQRELAEEAGVGHSAVFHIEQGVRPDPRVSTLQALARALGVTLDELAGPSTKK